MAILFSQVTLSNDYYGTAEFFVSGYPQDADVDLHARYIPSLVTIQLHFGLIALRVLALPVPGVAADFVYAAARLPAEHGLCL